MLADPFADVELATLVVLIFLLTASLGILCFLPRIALGMRKETWRELLWTSGTLTALSFVATLLHFGGFRALLSVPFIFSTWLLALLPCFYFGTRLRRRRQRLIGQTPAPENADDRQDA